MPELPEIEIVKRSLFKTIHMAKIIDIKIVNKNLRYKVPNFFSKNLIGETILKISRRSKYLIFHFKKKTLLIHLGMTGKLLLMRNRDHKLFKTSFYYKLNIQKKHNHIYIKLNNRFILIYNDVRRFGFFKFYNTPEISRIKFLNKLGPEPLSRKFNVEFFKNNIKKRKKNIKNLLMDQKFVSGLGNIYVNEALFMSNIHPLKECYNLEKNQIRKITFNIKKVLRTSISKGGSSIKDFKNTHGKSGEFQQFFHVYGKENNNCSRISCKGKIKKIVISGRSTFYCSKCQN
tara:strand:- start:322 stop:1185 length:864 start_codon:yes stop_codon:yes gene_type:complete